MRRLRERERIGRYKGNGNNRSGEKKINKTRSALADDKWWNGEKL